MKLVSLALALALTMALTGAALAQGHPVEGSYTVTAKSADLGTLNFALTLKKSGDKWTAEIKDSPMPLTVKTATVGDDNKVVVVADAGGTDVTIQGKFAEGKIDGDWTAGEMKGTWTALKGGAAADTKAAVAAPASAVSGGAAPAPADGLEGTYDAKVVADGQGEFPFTLTIKNDAGKLKPEVVGGGDLLIVDVKMEGDNVTLVATYQGQGPIMFPGKRAGNDMGGKWEFGGFSGTWSAKKK
jgi:hypothetical protein